MILSQVIISAYLLFASSPCGYEIEYSIEDETINGNDGKIILQCKSNTINTTVTLYNLAGNKEVGRSSFDSSKDIEFDNLTSGKYLIQLEGSGCVQTVGGISGINIEVKK